MPSFNDAVVDHLSLEVTEVVRAIRAELLSRKCTLLAQERLYPKAFALAGLAHTCVLLERLDAERLRGDDMVSRILARAHWEAYVVSIYLLYGGWGAYINLAGSARRSLIIQHTQIQDANRRIMRNREKIRKDNDARATQNEGILARNRRSGDNIPLLELMPLPTEKSLDFDLGPILAQMTAVPESRFSIEDMERQALKLAAQAEGEQVRELTNYDFLYRSLSYLGAHPTHWVLEKYLEAPGLMIHVLPKAGVSPLAGIAVESGIGLTASLASRTLGAFGYDTSYFDDVVERWVDRATARTKRLQSLADLLAAHLAQRAADDNE